MIPSLAKVVSPVTGFFAARSCVSAGYDLPHSSYQQIGIHARCLHAEGGLDFLSLSAVLRSQP